MVGLDAAGKTTILYKLKLGEIVTTIPTIGKWEVDQVSHMPHAVCAVSGFCLGEHLVWGAMRITLHLQWSFMMINPYLHGATLDVVR